MNIWSSEEKTNIKKDTLKKGTNYDTIARMLNRSESACRIMYFKTFIKEF